MMMKRIGITGKETHTDATNQSRAGNRRDNGTGREVSAMVRQVRMSK